MASLLYADEYDYAAIIFRKTYADLNKDGALMDRAHEWLGGTAAKWNERDKRWSFPKGATLAFGYLDGPRDWQNYDSAEYQFEGFDEATQLRFTDYTTLLGRLRRKTGSRVPLRARSASNPGGESHDEFGERFVEPAEPHPERAFVPARLEDNPHLNREEYERVLENLDETLYRQRRHGEWIRDSGESVFKREWWQGKNRYRIQDTGTMWNRTVPAGRYIALDTANTVGQTSAYTALTVGDIQPDYRMALRHVAREKLEFPDLVDWTIEQVYPFIQDGKFEALLIESAASGIQLIQQLRRSAPPWLASRIVSVPPNRGPNGKEQGWKNAARWTKTGMVLLPEPHPDYPWLYPFEKELFAVPNSTFKDQADSFSVLVNEIERLTWAFSTRWRTLGAREPGVA